MNKYKIILYFIDPDEVRHPLGAGIFWCNSSEEACECAMQTWWDPRLEAAGCRPFHDCTQLPQFRVHWEFDDDSDQSYLEQWDTPEKYYDVQPICPKCGDHSMTYEEGHIFTCDRVEVESANCDGQFDGLKNAGDSAGTVLIDGEPQAWEDYKLYYGNPDRHAILLCRVERRCNACRGWETVDVLGGVDFMDDDNYEIGVFHETELDKIYNSYQLMESKQVLDEAQGDSLFPTLGEHIRNLT